MLTFISLFAGIGGFDLGFERAGLQCVAQVEKNSYALRVLHKHWPDVPKFEDIHDVGKHNLPAADIVAGGFPCQPHSVAGKRRGAADDRNLWPEMRRVIAELRPAWVVAENVPGIRTTILDCVLSDLEALGFAAGTIDVPAVALGAWHIRHRIFIVAHADCHGCHGQGVPVLSAFGRESGYYTDVSWHSAIVSDAQGVGCGRRAALQTASGPRRHAVIEGSYPWAAEPDVGRVAYGVPSRVDRLRALGNAVVPQVAQFIGRGLVETEYELRRLDNAEMA